MIADVHFPSCISAGNDRQISLVESNCNL